MREVDVSELAAKFDQLLDEVERGATIRITRDGHPVACLVSEDEARRLEAAAAV